MTQILAYPNLILYPNDASAVQVVVSELAISSVSGVVTGKVVGSWANANATAAAVQTATADQLEHRRRLHRGRKRL